jgi:hypothetical protein
MGGNYITVYKNKFITELYKTFENVYLRKYD